MSYELLSALCNDQDCAHGRGQHRHPWLGLDMLGASKGTLAGCRCACYCPLRGHARRRYATSSADVEKAKEKLKQARQRARGFTNSDDGTMFGRRVRGPVQSPEAIREELTRLIRAEGPMPVDRFMRTVNDALPRPVGWHTGDLSDRALKHDWTSNPYGSFGLALAVAFFFQTNHDMARLSVVNGRKEAIGRGTRLVFPFPDDSYLPDIVVSCLGNLRGIQPTLKMIQLVDPSPARRQARASTLRRVTESWGRKLVLIEPGQVMPPPQRHELYLQWFRTLDEVPLTPDYWTMVFAQDYLSGLPVRVAQRNGTDYHEAFVTLSPEDPRKLALGTRSIPLPKSPWSASDVRPNWLRPNSLAIVPDELARVSQRLAEITAGRSNLSPFGLAAQPSRPDARFQNLIVERANRRQRRLDRRPMDVDAGAANSVGGAALFIEPTTTSLTASLPLARTPGKKGSAFFMDDPGSANLVSPVDIQTFEASVNNISRVATYKDTLRSFCSDIGFSSCVAMCDVGCPHEVLSTARNMSFGGSRYSVLAIEAPPFSLECHRQFVAGRQKREWAAKTGQGDQSETEAQQFVLDNEGIARSLLPFVPVPPWINFDEDMGPEKMEHASGAVRRQSILSTILGYFTLVQLTYYFISQENTPSEVEV